MVLGRLQVDQDWTMKNTATFEFSKECFVERDAAKRLLKHVARQTELR